MRHGCVMVCHGKNMRVGSKISTHMRERWVVMIVSCQQSSAEWVTFQKLETNTAITCSNPRIMIPHHQAVIMVFTTNISTDKVIIYFLVINNPTPAPFKDE